MREWYKAHMDLKTAILSNARQTLRELGPKARNGAMSPEEEARWSLAEAAVEADAPAAAPVRTIFDLPVAAGMWAADGRSVERG